MANRGLVGFICGNNPISSSSFCSVKDNDDENEDAIEFP
jgi:hypothetical protein